MKIFGDNFKILLIGIFMVGIFAGCTKHPGEEEIQALEEAKSAAISAEQTLADKKRESQEAQAKCDEKKQELEKVKQEKAKVMQKLDESAPAEE